MTDDAMHAAEACWRALRLGYDSPQGEEILARHLREYRRPLEDAARAVVEEFVDAANTYAQIGQIHPECSVTITAKNLRALAAALDKGENDGAA